MNILYNQRQNKYLRIILSAIEKGKQTIIRSNELFNQGMIKRDSIGLCLTDKGESVLDELEVYHVLYGHEYSEIPDALKDE